MLVGDGGPEEVGELDVEVEPEAEQTRTRRALGREERVNPHSLQYINRLSDLLFVFARVLARRGGSGEIYWQPRTESDRQ